MSNNVTIRGADRLAATTRAAARDLGDMHSASSHVAADLAQSARGRAPRRSGRLRASITAQTPAPNTARVVAVAPYGIHVEHGTRFMRAQPFLTPTLEARKGATVAAYRAAVIKALNGIKGA